MTHQKAKCDGCKKLINCNKLTIIKGEFLCHKCKTKILSVGLMRSASLIGRPILSVDDVTNRIYSLNNGVYLVGSKSSLQMNLPLCMKDKKFKIVIVEDSDDSPTK